MIGGGKSGNNVHWARVWNHTCGHSRAGPLLIKLPRIPDAIIQVHLSISFLACKVNAKYSIVHVVATCVIDHTDQCSSRLILTVAPSSSGVWTINGDLAVQNVHAVLNPLISLRPEHSNRQDIFLAVNRSLSLPSCRFVVSWGLNDWYPCNMTVHSFVRGTLCKNF